VHFFTLKLTRINFVSHSLVDQATILRMPAIQPPVPSRVLKSYITSQYRTYEMMHHYLHHPRHFAGQFMFPLSQSAKQHLIERYASSFYTLHRSVHSYE